MTNIKRKVMALSLTISTAGADYAFVSDLRGDNRIASLPFLLLSPETYQNRHEYHKEHIKYPTEVRSVAFSMMHAEN